MNAALSPLVASFLALLLPLAAAGAPASGRPDIDAWIVEGRAQAAAGDYARARASAEQGLALAEQNSETDRLPELLTLRGNARLALRDYDGAAKDLEGALEVARARSDAALESALLNDLGNLHWVRGDGDRARALYEQVVERADAPTDVRVQSTANAARIAAEAGDGAAAAALVQRGREFLETLPPANRDVRVETHLGRTLARIASLPDLPPADRARAQHAAAELLTRAGERADAQGDLRLASFAFGYRAELYRDAGRPREALTLAREALLRAQQAESPDSAYRWHWLLGRLHAAEGERDAAIDDYREAVRLLQEIRHQMSVGYGLEHSFQNAVGPVYLELVDLLLGADSDADSEAVLQARLRQARDTVELLKAAELRDYFRDDCVDELLAKTRDVGETASTAAVVYPILLDRRTELLVDYPAQGMRQYTVPVGREELGREVARFRSLLEKRITYEYLEPAQKLEQWLLDPLEADLAAAGIDTLVFVPDGPLRTIPMAALHDGERYLAERYAVAVTPGVDLTDPRPLDREGLRILAAGISESVEGYAPLPNVPEEIKALAQLYETQTLLDGDFRVGALERSVEEESFGVVHIATHGEFGSKSNQTFLLAYDGHMDMDRLAETIGRYRFRDQPLELLTLSACETAAGDERAALGLSGIAVKAGARSALGSLWKVDDAAARMLVVQFYTELSRPGVSRARALQAAQRALLEDFRYRHPAYWSAFLLINSWL